MTFGTGNSKWSGPIPDPALPNNGIYAFSTDLNPASCAQGTIYTHYIDGRYFVIEFNQVQHYPSGNPETFEIILDLDTGMVRIQFMTVSDATEAVVGVENSTGTEATQYAYADPGMVYDGVAVSFYPAYGTPPPTGGPGDLMGLVSDLVTANPIGNALVTAQAFTGGAVYSYTTGADGIYSDTLCADWYTMTASASGYYSSTPTLMTLNAGAQAQQNFALQSMLKYVYLPIVVKIVNK